MRASLIIFISIFSLAFLISCKREKIELDNLNNGELIVLGHGGMGTFYKYPRNSKESIISVMGIGAEGSEIDVQMTKDSVLVAFHDDEMNFTTTCKNRICDQYWADIDDCVFHSVVRYVYVLDLDYLFSVITQPSQHYFSFDCKIPDVENNTEFMRRFARAIKRHATKYNLNDKLIIEGKVEFLEILQEQNVTAKLFVTQTADMDQAILWANTIGAYGVGFGSSITKEDVKQAHDNNLFVMVWEASTDAQNLEALKKNIDIIQTDKPIPLLKKLGRFNRDYSIP